MDPYISKKLSILRFAAVASVVVFHAYPPGWQGGYLQDFVSLALMRWALPFLGLVSGYLFFRTFTPTLAGYAKKLRSRTRTIAVPFLIWSGVAVLFAALTGNPEYGGPIDSAGDALYHWLLRPPASPLWFLQALMACVVLSPLVYLAVRTLRLWVLPLALAWWATGLQPDGLGPWISAVAFPPFITGAAIALLRPKLGWAKRPAPLLVVVSLTGVWLAASALFALYGLGLGGWFRSALLPVVVLGVCTIWLGFDALRGPLRAAPWLPAAALFVAPLSFFVYASQQPQLKVIVVTLRDHAGGLPAAAYLAAPLLTIAFSISAALLFRWVAPRAFALVSGGRAAPRRAGPARPGTVAQQSRPSTERPAVPVELPKAAASEA